MSQSNDNIDKVFKSMNEKLVISESRQTKILSNLHKNMNEPQHSKRNRQPVYYFTLAAVGIILFLLVAPFFDSVVEKPGEYAHSEELHFEGEDVVAILNGHEIKARDVLSQYTLTENNILTFLKEEIVILEAISMGITVSEEEIVVSKSALFPGASTTEIFEMLSESEKEFYQNQATSLGISPEDYFEIWNDAHHTRQAFIQKYIAQQFETPSSAEKGEEWGQNIDNHINNLFESYKENGDLVIKY